jgi:hypothetical protein
MFLSTRVFSSSWGLNGYCFSGSSVHVFWHTEQIYCPFDRLFYGFFFHPSFPRNVSRGSCVRSSIGSSLGLTHSGRKSFNSFCKILFLFLLYGYPGPCFADPWWSTVFLTRFSSRLPYIRGSWSHSRFHLTNWFAWVTFLLILASVQLDLSSSDPLLTLFSCWHYVKFFFFCVSISNSDLWFDWLDYRLIESWVHIDMDLRSLLWFQERSRSTCFSASSICWPF